MKVVPLLTALLAGLAGALAVLPDAAHACSPHEPNGRPPTQAERDGWMREGYRRAAAVVEVVAETPSNMERPGRMRVLRVYKGNVRVGTTLTMRGADGAMCGIGDFLAGSRGILVIDRLREPLYFYGYLPAHDLAQLRAVGLMPPH